MTNDQIKRLERLEKGLFYNTEIEDLRAVDIEIYGLDAIREIYEEEGPESLIELLESQSLSEKAAAAITAFLSDK